MNISSNAQKKDLTAESGELKAVEIDPQQICNDITQEVQNEISKLIDYKYDSGSLGSLDQRLKQFSSTCILIFGFLSVTGVKSDANRVLQTEIKSSLKRHLDNSDYQVVINQFDQTLEKLVAESFIKQKGNGYSLAFEEREFEEMLYDKQEFDLKERIRQKLRDILPIVSEVLNKKVEVRVEIDLSTEKLSAEVQAYSAEREQIEKAREERKRIKIKEAKLNEQKPRKDKNEIIYDGLQQRIMKIKEVLSFLIENKNIIFQPFEIRSLVEKKSSKNARDIKDINEQLTIKEKKELVFDAVKNFLTLLTETKRYVYKAPKEIFERFDNKEKRLLTGHTENIECMFDKKISNIRFSGGENINFSVNGFRKILSYIERCSL